MSHAQHTQTLFCLFPVAPASPRTPSLGAKNQHAGQEVAGPSHVAISAISANMDSFARGRTATLKKQPSHIEATHFGDLGTEHTCVWLWLLTAFQSPIVDLPEAGIQGPCWWADVGRLRKKQIYKYLLEGLFGLRVFQLQCFYESVSRTCFPELTLASVAGSFSL